MNQFTDWDILACIALSLLPLFAFVADGSAKMRFFPKRQKTGTGNSTYSISHLKIVQSSYFRHKLTNFRECSATVCELPLYLNATTFFAIYRGGNKDK